MEQIVGWGFYILVIILTGINWTIYHKMFKITYFGNAFRQIIGELIVCGIFAYLELGLLKVIFDIVFPILIVVVGCGVVFAVIKAIVSNKNSGSVGESNDNSVDS